MDQEPSGALHEGSGVEGLQAMYRDIRPIPPHATQATGPRSTRKQGGCVQGPLSQVCIRVHLQSKWGQALETQRARRAKVLISPNQAERQGKAWLMDWNHKKRLGKGSWVI